MVVATSPIASAKAHVAAAGPGKQKAQKIKHHKVSNHDPTIYDSIIDPNPGNVPSLSFEATGTAQFGNQINFSGTSRVLNTVDVQMSSWACQSGSWTGSPSPCATTPGATFSVPITLNIYGVGPATGNGPSTVGALLATDTQTFAIPYRPSADPINCPSNPTHWYYAGLDTCFNGFFTDIGFTFGHITLPNSVIYGITFNTNTAGPNPLGHTGPTDSLNVALSNSPTAPSVGSNSYPGTLYWNIIGNGYQSNYCDAGASGIDTFRIDEPTGFPANNGTNSGCWGNGTAAVPWFIPAVQFNALVSPSPTITSSATASVVAGTPFSFTVTTTGVPTPAVTKLSGKLPVGLAFHPGVGTATITGTAPKTDRNKSYTIAIQAKNARRSVARQHLTLTLTGGK